MSERDNTKKQQARLSTETTTMLQMERVLDRLKRLNYEEYYVKLRRNKPIGRHHFVSFTSSGSLQIREYLTLVSWLLSVIYGSEDHPAHKVILNYVSGQELDAGVCIDKIIEVLDQLRSTPVGAASSADASSSLAALKNMPFLTFTAASMKLAYGEEIVQSLDFLSSKACDKLFLRFEPIRRLQMVDDDSSGEKKNELFESICNIEEGKVGGNYNGEGHSFGNSTEAHHQCDKAWINQREIIHSSIPPDQWRAEFEIVLPQLKGSNNPHLSAGDFDVEWRAHLLQANEHQEKMHLLLPWIDTQINCASKSVANDVGLTRAKSKVMAKRFGSLFEEYSKASEDCKNLDEKYQQTFTKVQNLKEDVSELEEFYSITKREVNEKGKSMSDTTPLLNLKTALQNIKLEIKNFDVRIGILNHIFFHAKTNEKDELNAYTNLVLADDEM
mmetsp:Transcript_29515/g.42222  ORF Transcript_29515/g.42222 Transcript_29515/m.42222 type:complete len:443 (-) Transcript_29515:207-1535(-)